MSIYQEAVRLDVCVGFLHLEVFQIFFCPKLVLVFHIDFLSKVNRRMYVKRNKIYSPYPCVFLSDVWKQSDYKAWSHD
jgi:hypothetical protein